MGTVVKMKTIDRNATRQGNLTYRKTTVMGVAKGALADILNNQIEMYNQPYVAALREYTSNARDSNRAAGTVTPVEVELPNPFSAALVIRDHGLGMDEAELEQCVQFGGTSKDDNDDDIGGFGLGFKSGLAIAARFTVTSVKNGIKYVGVVHRDEHGAPTLGWIGDPTEVDEPNGVTISIPTNEVDKLRSAIDDGLFLGWEPGSITITGWEKDLVSLHDNPDFEYHEGMGWFYRGDTKNKPFKTTNYYGLAHIANVGFPLDWSQIDSELEETLRAGLLSNFVFEIPNGKVNLLRSREGLIYKKATTKLITDILDKVMDFGASKFQAELDKAENVRDAYKVFFEARRNGYTRKPLYFRGQKMEEWIPSTLVEGVQTPAGWNSTHWIQREYPGAPIKLHASYLGHASYSGYNRQVSRSTEYMPDKKGRGRSHPSVLTGSLNPVLVHSSRPGKKPTANVSEAATANTFFDAMSRKGEKKNTLDVYFTSYNLDELNPLWVELFTTVISADEYREINSAERKLKAAEQKAAYLAKNPGGPAASGPTSNVRVKAKRGMVKRLTPLSVAGYPREEAVEYESLDTNKMHVVLDPTSSIDVQDRSILMTKTWRSSHSLRYGMILQLQKTYDFDIIVYNKSDKTPQDVPNVVTLGELAQRMWKETYDAVSEEELQIAKESYTLPHILQSLVPSKKFDSISLKDTRTWLKKIYEEHKSNAIATRIMVGNDTLRKLDSSGLLPDDWGSVRPGLYDTRYHKSELHKRYPMISTMGDWVSSPIKHEILQDLVNYINTKDAAALAA